MEKNLFMEKNIEILSAHSELENAYQYLQENDNLNRLDMNSISFIKMIIDIEREFGFEFEDEALDYNKFTSLTLLLKYIEDQMRLNNLTYDPGENKQDNIKKEMIKIISKYSNIPIINQYSLNNLKELNLTLDNFNEILFEIQEQFNVVLDNDIIEREHPYIMDNLCQYLLKMCCNYSE